MNFNNGPTLCPVSKASVFGNGGGRSGKGGGEWLFIPFMVKATFPKVRECLKKRNFCKLLDEALCVLTPLIFKTTHQGSYFYHPHFTDKVKGALRS